MATNAPYYQLRAGGVNSTTAAAQTETTRDEEYGSTPVMATKVAAENQHLPLYPEHATRSSGGDGHSDFEENHNLVELLEAATTAADQDPHAVHASNAKVATASTDGKRKRASSFQTDAAASNENDSNLMSKRRRIALSTDPNLDSNDVDITMCSPASKNSPSPSRDALTVDARAAGVHSATALFRRSTSNATRKYTRPPMSKLFMSLNITPENFIALQALAKAYMLSPTHPERQSCVGNRGKGDTDMVKLRLFNCVRDFLTEGGVGEQYFGEHVEKLGERESHEAAAALGEEEGGGEKLVWPRDGNKIISLVTPLMRRMVTNERQRLYAIDTRKGGKKVDKESSAEAHGHQSSPAPDVVQLQTALDPTLQRPLRSSPSAPSAATSQPHTFSAKALTSGLAPPASPKSSHALLPTATTEPHLTNINIFLLYTPAANSKPIKLDEKRISTSRPAHLTFYNYTAFLEQVASMVQKAELLHPSVKPSSSGGGGSDAELVGKSSGGSETELRGLAAAANALHDDEQAQLAEAPSCVGAAAAARCTVKTIGPTGWRVIDSAESWYNVLTERAFAVWADGVCNVIVEMGGERSTVGAALEGGGEAVMEDA